MAKRLNFSSDQLKQPERVASLLLTDVIMLMMSGRQLAENLAALRPGLKVLLIFAYGDIAIVPHGLLEENIPFLPKRFTLDSLTHKVRKVLDAPRQAA